MNEGLIPRRYAKALYLFAQEKGNADELYGLMGTLVASFQAHPELQTALANPYVSATDKTELASTAAGVFPGKSPVFHDFLKLLEQNRRLSFLHEIALAYLDMYRDERHIYVVKVESAAPMSDADREKLTSLIARHLKGGSMEYVSSVNPDLIGGFKVSVGNDRIDATVSNELKQLRLNLIRK